MLPTVNHIEPFISVKTTTQFYHQIICFSPHSFLLWHKDNSSIKSLEENDADRIRAIHDLILILFLADLIKSYVIIILGFTALPCGRLFFQLVKGSGMRTHLVK